jgi:hypothetical protein
MVYVDNYRARLGRMVMFHMVADTRAELHLMADRIGMKREWFQDCPPHSAPHYDVSLSKRTEAIRLGAVMVDRHHFVEVIRRARAAGWP